MEPPEGAVPGDLVHCDNYPRTSTPTAALISLVDRSCALQAHRMPSSTQRRRFSKPCRCVSVILSFILLFFMQMTPSSQPDLYTDAEGIATYKGHHLTVHVCIHAFIHSHPLSFTLLSSHYRARVQSHVAPCLALESNNGLFVCYIHSCLFVCLFAAIFGTLHALSKKSR